MVPYKWGHGWSCVQNKGWLSRCLWPGLAFTVWTLPEQTMHGANLRSPECSFWLRRQTELNSSEWWGTPAFYNNRSALLASVHAVRETTVWIFIISCQQMTGRQTLSPLVVWKVALFFSDCPGVTSPCQKGSQCEMHWSRTCLFIWLYVFIYLFEFLTSNQVFKFWALCMYVFLSIRTYCIMSVVAVVLHQSILIRPRFVTQLPCVSWGDTLRRWDDQNGPTFLSLHRWEEKIHFLQSIFGDITYSFPSWLISGHLQAPHRVLCVQLLCVSLVCAITAFLFKIL